ncbi:MAG: FAD-binding oxidoreductase [Candidatus Geothermincolia bacterium]
MSGTGFSAMRDSLREILPEGALVEDSAALREHAAASYPVPEGCPCGVVRPADAQQVGRIVQLAKEKGINLVPVSSGPPHVKGGSVPAGDGIVVDLSGMDAIARLDRRNKVAVVEPGVTFGALCEAARREGLRPVMPLLPRSTKSVVASCLEREPTIIPKYHWDMTDPLLCAEIVFGTGDVFRTGSAAGPGTLEDQWALGNAQKNPMGPAATDLTKLVQGAQGTMGIVTWASIRLELAPSVRRVRFVSSDNLEAIVAMAYELCRKKLGDEMLILDSVDLARIIPCAPKSAKEKCKVNDASSDASPGFALIYAVAGYPGYLPEERAAYQERDAGDIAAKLGLRATGDCGGISGRDLAGLLDGPCPGEHWKSRPEGACQDVFFLTTMDRVPTFVEVMGGLASRHGIGPGQLGTYVQPVLQGRSCHLEFNIFYDPADEAARARAHTAAADASSVMASMGAFFSRPYEPWVKHSFEPCRDTVDALRRVKGVFDPGDIMNRGKLCFEGGVTDGAR